MTDVSPALIEAIEAGLMARKGRRLNIQGARQIEFQCLAHADEHPSAHWHPVKQVWKCRSCGAGGGFTDAAKRLGLNLADFSSNAPTPIASRRERLKPTNGQEPTRVYTYVVNGIEFKKARYEFPDKPTDEGKPSKTFEWTPLPSKHDLQMEDFPLHWLEDPKKRPDDPVIFVEGEKVVEACWERQLLATCGAWSGSARNFGRALLELQGREVWLAADNDETGYTYMQAIADALRGTAKSVHWVRVPLGPKQDLADFFAAGGRTEAIFEGDIRETVTQVKGFDHVLIREPSDIGILAFDCDEITFTARSIDCEIAVTLEGAAAHKPFTRRINLLSDSAINSLRMDLAKYLGAPKELNWVQVLNNVVASVRAVQRTTDYSMDVFDIPEPSTENCLIPDILPRDQPTIFFGDGSSLKSYIAKFCAVAVALGAEFPGVPGRIEHGRVMYLDFENIGPGDFRRRIDRIFAGMGVPVPPDAIRYWPGRGIPLHNQIGAIARFVREHNVRLVVIDGIIGAITGKPEDADTAAMYFQDLARLETTTISIAHITKRDDPQSILKPYGTGYWHNFARRTWYLRKVGAEGADKYDLGMYCRKVNEGPLPQPIALGVSFTGRQGPVDIVSRSFLDPAVDRTLDRLRSPDVRLKDALRQRPMDEKELASVLGVAKPETVTQMLKRYPFSFEETNMGWQIRSAATG